MLGRIIPVITRRTAQRGIRSYHEERILPVPKFNDLPVPQGCWKEAYERDQKKFNATLLAGIAFLTGTLAIGKMNGWLYLNLLPPKPE